MKNGAPSGVVGLCHSIYESAHQQKQSPRNLAAPGALIFKLVDSTRLELVTPAV